MSELLTLEEIRNRIKEVRKVRLGSIANHPKNWRGHPENQREGFRGVVREIGWAGVPMTYYSERNDGTLTYLDGHMRKEEVPDLEADVAITDLNDAEADLFLATYDPLGAAAAADREKLGALLGSVQSGEAGVQALLGELAEREGVVFGGNGKEPEPPEPQTDRAEELQAKWNVASGDVWQAGEHYVICGDCREAETWERLLQAAGVAKVNGVFTSPPYAEQRKQQYGGVPVAEYVDWWQAVQANVRANLADDGSFFVNIKPHCEDGQRVLYVFDLVLAMVRRWGWRFVDELCWTSQGTPGEWPDRFKNAFEPVYHFGLSKIKFCPGNVVIDFKSDASLLEVYGGNNSQWKSLAGSSYGGHAVKSKKYDGALPSNVVFAASSSFAGQSAAFSVALPDFFIRAYSDPGDVWLDPFLGSGTTICAAHQNKRRGLGIERLEKYTAVSIQRLADLGLEPHRVGG